MQDSLSRKPTALYFREFSSALKKTQQMNNHLALFWLHFLGRKPHICIDLFYETQARQDNFSVKGNNNVFVIKQCNQKRRKCHLLN